ncbi:MAG: DUF2950 family protein [Candidatus Acidiferrum sp.]|jgi:DUF2950 family protein
MISSETKTTKWIMAVIVVLAFAGAALAVRKNVGGKVVTQLTFQTPADAGKALDEAAKSSDPAELAKVLGVEAKNLLMSGDTDADKAAIDGFAQKYQQLNRWVDMSDGSQVLYIGADNFAFPMPLAKNASGKWYFDGVAGAQELRARDIGRNELLAIDACVVLANAEQIYAQNYSASGEFAQRVISSAGKQDGLYWPVHGTEASSPLGNLSQFPKSAFPSYPTNDPLVMDGYTLRILNGQGDDAPGGAKGYIVDGKMTNGFAILATPVKYGETGIMTFMIGPEGIAYEQDLGPETEKIAAAIQEYNPDESWWPVE